MRLKWDQCKDMCLINSNIGCDQNNEDGSQMTEGWEISILNNINHLLSPHSGCIAFIQIILTFVTHCFISIIIPMFCGGRFSGIKYLPEVAERVGV